MQNIILYATVVLIWGSTWFAIKLQVGTAPDEISIFYRAVMTAIGLIVLCKAKGLPLRFSWKNHIFLFLLGISMFSMHYLFIYNATSYMISGLVAVIFSSVGFFSILNNFIFFKVRPNLYTILGALIGISGLCIFFWTEVSDVSIRGSVLEGIALSTIGALVFSLGGAITKRNINQKLPLIPSTTIASIYGAIIIFIYTIYIRGETFIFPDNITYWSAVAYLSFLSSIIAFLCYFKIVQNTGPELAGYTTVVAPVVALIISSYIEGYEWSMEDIMGLLLVILGNVLVMVKKNANSGN